MEEMRDKLDRQDSRMVGKSDEFDNRITEVNTAKETLEKELNDLKVLVDNLKGKTEGDYTKAENSSDSAANRSEFEARLVELMSDFKSDELAPLKSQVFNMSSTISTLDYNINKAMDLINTVSNRLSLTR
jgi:methyl-accepting chemotaxis protein